MLLDERRMEHVKKWIEIALEDLLKRFHIIINKYLYYLLD